MLNYNISWTNVLSLSFEYGKNTLKILKSERVVWNIKKMYLRNLTN